jgi:hypothetical protein
MNLKEQVLYCLENYPDSRNSDIKLTNYIWVKFYNQYLTLDSSNNYTVKLIDLYHLPKEDNVKRYRAKIQNEKKLFLPTDPEILKKRQVMEEKWRKEIGYNPELRQVLTN